MVVKIASYNVFSSSALLVLSLSDGAKAATIACALHSRSQIRDVVKAYAIDETEQAAVAFLADTGRKNLPEVSDEPLIVMGGSAPQTMHNLICFMEAFAKTGSAPTTPRTGVLPRICALLSSKKSVIADGMIGHVDANEAFHFWIFFSKREGARILRSAGGSATERSSAETQIERCGLPPRGGEPVHLTGEIARYLCLASELRTHVDRTLN